MTEYQYEVLEELRIPQTDKNLVSRPSVFRSVIRNILLPLTDLVVCGAIGNADRLAGIQGVCQQ